MRAEGKAAALILLDPRLPQLSIPPSEHSRLCHCTLAVLTLWGLVYVPSCTHPEPQSSHHSQIWHPEFRVLSAAGPGASTDCLTPAQTQPVRNCSFFFFSWGRSKPARSGCNADSPSLTVPSIHIPRGMEAAKCQEAEMSARAIVPVVCVCQQVVQPDTDSDYKCTHKNSSPVRMASLNRKQFC